MIRKTSIFTEWFDQAYEQGYMTTIDELHAWLTHRAVSQAVN